MTTYTLTLTERQTRVVMDALGNESDLDFPEYGKVRREMARKLLKAGASIDPDWLGIAHGGGRA